MEALAQCYQASDTWQKRRQILSIMADKVRFTKLLRYIPCLTNYRFTDAKRHCLTYGRGGPVKSLRAFRRDIVSSQIKRFIALITSSHIVQDLPFGERSVTLSNKETIKIPNVMIPERVVKQYLADCDRMSFKPLSRSTLLRILAVLARLCLKVTSRLRLRKFCRIAGIWRLIRRRRKTWRRGKRHDGLDERYTESPSTWKALPQKRLQGKCSSYSFYNVIKHVNSSKGGIHVCRRCFSSE